MSQLTLMPIFAHPDDESFVGTGALIRYAQEGVRTVLVCATLGERGKMGDPPVCTPEELPAVREQELRNACALLGVAQLHLLGYKDKELGQADETEAVGKIVAAIRAERPQALYTFPPDGHSGHVDHLAINRLVSLAFRAAGDPAAYPEAGAPWQPSHLWWHILPGQTPEPAHAMMDTTGTETTWVSALRAHRSQHLSIERVFHQFAPTFLRTWMDQQQFHLADTVLQRPSQPVDDLFFGVR